MTLKTTLFYRQKSVTDTTTVKRSQSSNIT